MQPGPPPNDVPPGNDPSGAPGAWQIAPSQWRLFFAILVIGGAGLIYAVLRHEGMGQTAALYLGLPLLLALGLSLTPQAKSATGATMKGMTIALLLAAPVFQEGYICILLASPIFYLVGVIVGLSIDHARRRGDAKSKLESALVVTLVAVMALEGTSAATSFPRDHEVVVSKIVPAPVEAVREALAAPPAFGKRKPLFLRIFPYPVAMQGAGLKVGDERRATFVAYKHIFWNRVEGDAVFAVTEATDRKVVFALKSDTSYVGHYVGWKRSEVELEATDPGHTLVTWRLSFHRMYDPYWYFGTLQKYAVRLVAEELIDHAATPRT